VRQNHSVAVFDNGRSRALPSLKIHGVSTFDGMPPAEYFAAARAELARYPDFQSVDAEIVELRKLDNATFEARDGQGKTYQGKKVILANGVKDCFPDIEGYAAAWGKGM
jgi:thioredoxin reductase